MPVVVTSLPVVIGGLLVQLRKKAGLSQGDLAKVVGVNTSTWSRFENGESSLTVEQLIACSSTLGTTPGAFVELVQRVKKLLEEQGVVVSKSKSEAEDVAEKLRVDSVVVPLFGAALLPFLTALGGPIAVAMGGAAVLSIFGKGKK